MIDKNFHITAEPLWYVPSHIRDRLLNGYRGDAVHAHFLLCGLYCLVAEVFLLIFGFAAMARGEQQYAFTILGFAFVTVLTYGAIWFSGAYQLANHFVTLLMGLLALFLFYTGGTDDTGLLFCLVFPLIALFLQGTRAGVASVILLMMLLGLMQTTGIFAFDTSKYSDVLYIRVMSIYLIITVLSFLFSYFRHRAENAMLLLEDDMRQLAPGDLDTGMANRVLLERLLFSELSRARRYHSDCSILLLEHDQSNSMLERFGTDYLEQIQNLYINIFSDKLRKQDIPGRWDGQRFLVLLPETGKDGAGLLCQRLLQEFSVNSLNLRGLELHPTISIGGALAQGDDPHEIMLAAETNLQTARARGGNQAILN